MRFYTYGKKENPVILLMPGKVGGRSKACDGDNLGGRTWKI